METCPCGSKKEYQNCCEPIINGTQLAKTAEACMRSRYTAFVKGEIDHIKNTFDPNSQNEFDSEETKNWSSKSQWQGLDILNVIDGMEKDETGQVEFIARYKISGLEQQHHELSEFKKIDDKWYFIDGKEIKSPFKRSQPKVGRNDPCPCGSGKKFKKCCG
ncbi:MAG: YchJ family protein [Halobacteriovoraceae bacterium]|nr:YchJ family protein [Halobacteriovoraceae bacterium]